MLYKLGFVTVLQEHVEKESEDLVVRMRKCANK